MLTVGIDLRPTEPGFKAHVGRGTGRYAEELTKRLHALPENGLRIQDVRGAALTATNREKSLVSMLPFGRMTFETQVLFPLRMRRCSVNGMHFFAHGDAPAWSPVPYIVTVLDLIPLRFPELYKANKSNLRFKFARYLEYQAIKNAAGILAISEATKRDVVNLLGVAPERIVVTPLAAAGVFATRDLQTATFSQSLVAARKTLGVDPSRNTLLYVGGIDPRKNVPFLIDLLAALAETMPEEDVPQLLLVGNYEKDDQFPKLQQRIAEKGVTERVKLLGFVPDDLLPTAYAAANIFMFPSLYEGFGFPVLEAMSCGVPVIAGDNSSIPEVAGTKARLLPDNDIRAWAEATKSLLESTDAQIAQANEGLKQSLEFSWDTTAALTKSAYETFLTPLAQVQ